MNLDDQPLVFGINASTGKPLEMIPLQDCPPILLQQEDIFCRHLGTALTHGRPRAGVVFDVNPDDLRDAGWGIIFPAKVDPKPWLEALDPLLALRQSQACERFRIFSGEQGYKYGETANQWLNRHGAALMLIDPACGVPFYLTLVGPPTEIPFCFQYSLDIVAGVGRLDFPALDDYRCYATSVVAFERDNTRTTRREIELFATCHDFDRATQLFTHKVAVPFAYGDDKHPPLGSKYGFHMCTALNGQATKAKFRQVLCHPVQAPSLLITGTHGIAFDYDDPRQTKLQGAIVCDDWPGYGVINDQHWFSSEDVPDNANLHGALLLLFACYSAGTPQYDDFQFSEKNRQIASIPVTSRLPQKLMTIPNGGVLAVLGHVDRAWASSFQTRRGTAQPQGLGDVVSRVLFGQRVGLATDEFNSQWGVWSAELVDLLRRANDGEAIKDADLLALRTMRDDCRNYVVLGDPAVRLRAQSQPENEEAAGLRRNL
ncbi:C25 family cysteine peptidase [Buttiauxella sp. A111]|uniref:C25 family cysteine peptidase n=1 Tax=Buttiauxella sp. A111 TaxID=2563088 RepID=UPI0010E616A4|nr:C25 family cysteine peptidase [Buttiauxella sp. A111]GDX04616.1 hypothetical protein BSPA111_07840 [Buttiauxella sp. A111]